MPPKKPIPPGKSTFDTFQEILEIIDILHASGIGYNFHDGKHSPVISVSFMPRAYAKATKLLPHLFPERVLREHGETVEWRVKGEK